MRTSCCARAGSSRSRWSHMSAPAERREVAAREWSIRAHAQQEEMLDDPDVGLVVVGTPPSAHLNPVLAALHAGKHVVCEKPFAVSLDEADRMIDAAASRNLALT